MRKLFISDRDVRLAGTEGDIILMEAGVAQNVPISLRELAVKRGCRPVDGEKVPPAPTPVSVEGDAGPITEGEDVEAEKDTGKTKKPKK